MKNFAIRLSVLVLAATGFASSTIASKANSPAQKLSPVVVAGIPTPMCMPSSGKTCGMD